jgi:hypothetical protein
MRTGLNALRVRYFERFSGGSSIWRATMFGRFEAERRMQEFAECSENTFYTIDIQSAEYAKRGASLCFAVRKDASGCRVSYFATYSEESISRIHPNS